MNSLNVMSLLMLRKDVITIPDDYCVRQALEKFRYHGIDAMPIVDKDGIYIGTLSRGDIISSYDLPDQKVSIMSIPRSEFNPPLMMDASLKDVCLRILEHSFVPMVDGRGVLIGIITRKALVRVLVSDIID